MTDEPLDTSSGEGADEERSEKKWTPDYERFEGWVDEAQREARRRAARPLLRMVALLVVIICLGLSASQPGGIKAVLMGSDHPRTPLPVGISGGPVPEWSEENVRAAVEQVKPRAAQCLEGWSAVAMNQEGQVVVEVVLTPDGPEEAALYDQVGTTPTPVAECLGAAIGSVSWPLPKERQALPFPIVGG